MQTVMTEKHKIMAFVLSKEFGYTQDAIAQLMQVSQSTISNAIKEVNYWQTIRNLSTELDEARAQLRQLGYSEPKLIQPVYMIENKDIINEN